MSLLVSSIFHEHNIKTTFGPIPQKLITQFHYKFAIGTFTLHQEKKNRNMYEGRGSASMNMVTMKISLLLLLFLSESANAATYNVGGPGGWTYNTDTWPNSKKFRAGDVLIFNYDSTIHNVVAVDKGGYGSCKAPGGAKVFSSGSDQIRLARGQSYFICSIPGHCQSGMKVSINAV